MAWSKREIISEALIEIGLGTTQVRPQDLDSAGNRLDALLASWSGQGADTGASVENSANTRDLDEVAQIPMDAVRGVICALAVEIAPSFGKTPMPNTMKAAEAGRLLMMRKAAEIPSRKTDRFKAPAGAGHRTRRTYLADDSTEILEGER